MVTGGAGFIGSAVCRLFVGELRRDGAQCRQADLRGQSRLAAADRKRPATTAFAGPTSATGAAIAALLDSFAPDAVLHLAAESHVDRSIDGPGDVHRRPISTAPTRCWRRRSTIGARCRPSAPGGSAFTTSRPTRCSARSARPGMFSEDEPLPAEFALCRVEGGLRPSGARLARDLRPAGRAEQLLEQLRALPFPGKADPAGDPQGAARRADPGLRQGRQCARLALCRGPCPRAARGR